MHIMPLCLIHICIRYGCLCVLGWLIFAYMWRGLRVVGSIVSGNAKASGCGTTTVGLHVFYLCLYQPIYNPHSREFLCKNKLFMKKGEIFWAIPKEREGKNPHPIVYWEPCEWDSNQFKACILSTKSTDEYCRVFNVPMLPSHIQPTKPNGKPYLFQFKTTHLVVQGFMKDDVIICKPCVGKLTEEGIRFVTEHIQGSTFIDFPKPIKTLTAKELEELNEEYYTSMSNISSNNHYEEN